MTVRRLSSALFALAALLCAAGCGGGDHSILGPETEESLYLQGKQQLRQGRNPEALVSFLKVIERRGEQASAESHFEAGLIYLQHIKDYIEAIHHFQKFLELKPNSPQAQGVRDLVNTAKREFVKSVHTPSQDNFSVRPESAMEAEQLRRENEELRAQLATLRGGSAAPVNRVTRGLMLPEPIRPGTRAVPSDESPISSVPMRSGSSERPAAASVNNARSTSGAKPAASGRTYQVKPGDTLYSIATKQLGSGRRVDELKAANRDAISDSGALKPGATLRLP